tara:strand:- start:5475 stop:6353 length:879 start_codon:yes stop_codon:yes gene_type:complete
MKKDFLFLNYSWVENSTTYFKFFEKMGHTCDHVTEKEIFNFDPSGKDYKVVVVYLHGPEYRSKVDWILSHFPSCLIMQHDDSDENHVQLWTTRHPDLVMQRELTGGTINPYNCPVEGFHFPMKSIYKPEIEKETDVFFYARLTNPRRAPFIRHIQYLMNGPMSDLKWDTLFTNIGQLTPDRFKVAANKAKIGLHYFGNSYDSHRIWELASCKTAIIMPKLILNSTSESCMPFDSYSVIRDDFSDTEDKIRDLLVEDKWKSLALEAYDNYENNHTPEKCCEYYYNKVKQHLCI